MSHFSCLVVTDTRPSEDELQEILLPWHEYECTGIERYVEFVPTDLAELAKEQAKYGQEGQTLEEFAQTWDGSAPNDEGVLGRWTNPNARWYWWQIGGRWSGAFLAGYDPHEDPANREPCYLCVATGMRGEQECNGCDGTGVKVKWPTEWVNTGNQIRWGTFDSERARSANVARRRKSFVEACEKLGLTPAKARQDWPRYTAAIEALRQRLPAGKNFAQFIDEQKLRGDADAVLIREAAVRNLTRETGLSNDDVDVDAWSEGAEGLGTFAMVKDGVWYERGKMGWFACVADEKEGWGQEFEELLATVRPDQWLTMVDCHI